MDVETTEELGDATVAEFAKTDALVMAAAVADFRPAQVAEQKIKKSAVPEIHLEKTVDILTAVADARSFTQAARRLVRTPQVALGEMPGRSHRPRPGLSRLHL